MYLVCMYILHLPRQSRFAVKAVLHETGMCFRPIYAEQNKVNDTTCSDVHRGVQASRTSCLQGRLHISTTSATHGLLARGGDKPCTLLLYMSALAQVACLLFVIGSTRSGFLIVGIIKVRYNIYPDAVRTLIPVHSQQNAFDIVVAIVGVGHRSWLYAIPVSHNPNTTKKS